jgi:GNAT superfamily N-acetyltransferase
VQVLQAYTRHLSLIVGLFDEFRQHHGQPPNPEGARVFLAERLERRDSTIFFASEGSGSFQRALGFMQLYPSYSSVWMKRVWILSDLYVLPDFRRRGIARALHDRARQLAVETRASGLTFSGVLDNDAVRHFTEVLGYRCDGKAQEFFLRVDES